MQGDPGEGKTYFILAVASALTKGVQILNSEHQKTLTVIYQTADDGLADTIKPRLEMKKLGIVAEKAGENWFYKLP